MKKICLLLCIILSGCFSTPNSSFYMLRTESDKQVFANKLSIGVYDIVLPEYLDKPQIVLQKPNSTEITISEFNRWAIDLSAMLKNTLIEDLQQVLPNSKISALEFGVNSQYVVKVEIEKFSGWFNNKAVLQANWQILNQQGKIIFSKSSTYQKNIGKNYDSYVSAQSQLWADLAFDISKKLKNL